MVMVDEPDPEYPSDELAPDPGLLIARLSNLKLPEPLSLALIALLPSPMVRLAYVLPFASNPVGVRYRASLPVWKTHTAAPPTVPKGLEPAL